MDNKALHKLLLKNPSNFIASPQIMEVIQKTVYKFISKGGIQGLSSDDLVQEVIVTILDKKIDYVVKSYNPKMSTIKGYISKISFNICIELLRKHQNKPVLKNSLDDITEEHLEKDFNRITPESSFIEQEAIQEEISRLRGYLRMFAKYQYKFVLLLKLYCRMLIKAEDLQNFAPGISPKDLQSFLNTFGQEYNQYSDKEVYQLITPLINQVEGKKNSTDAVRKWVDTKILALKEVMNQNTSFRYDTETFKNLIRLL